jgi:hypothetical protein
VSPAPSTIERGERIAHARAVAPNPDSISWELRTRWALRKQTVLSLTDRCTDPEDRLEPMRRIEGRINHVATTGAFVVIDHTHVPLEDVLAVHEPHFTQGAA